MGDLDRLVQEAEKALETLRKLPAPVVEAMAAYELELAAAQAALKPHLDAADAAQKTLVSTRSKLSVAKAAVERAKARIGVANGGIADEEARIGRIQAGDQAELDALAKNAIEEKETVAAILRDFAPAYMAAKSTARIAVGMHLPSSCGLRRPGDHEFGRSLPLALRLCSMASSTLEQITGCA